MKAEEQGKKRSTRLTDEQISRRCPTCQFTRFVTGRFECQRKTCKYLTSRTSRYFKDK